MKRRTFLKRTSTPDPNRPPKYQTSFVMLSLSTTFPPGKKSRMLQSTHTMARGIRLMPRHLAKPPEHILTTKLQTPGLDSSEIFWDLDTVQAVPASERQLLTSCSSSLEISGLTEWCCRFTCLPTDDCWCFMWSFIVAPPLFRHDLIASHLHQTDLSHTHTHTHTKSKHTLQKQNFTNDFGLVSTANI